MSRSKKLPIVKDKPRNSKASIYWRRIRRTYKILTHKAKYMDETPDYPSSHSIVNDWDYSDYKFDYQHENLKTSEDKLFLQKLMRK
jgi:hypothetical protein